MCAGRNNLALIHQQNYIRIHNGRQPVGNNKAGSPLHQSAKSILNRHFANTVQRAGGFIQQQNIRVAQNRARNGNTLTLAAGKTHTFLANQRFIAL